jgi:hypothetical protein
MKEKSIGGARYYLLFKDDSTGYRYVYFLKQKSEVFTYFKQMVKELERDTGNKLKKFRSDRGREFCSKAFDTYLLDNLIKRETSAATTLQQNGFIERDNRIVTEAARSMIHDQGLPIRVWAEAINWAVHVLNRTINSQNMVETPYEQVFKRKPSVAYYRIFGCTAYRFVQEAELTKLDPKSKKCIFVGYSQTSRAYRIWDPSTDKVKETNDVTFDESLKEYSKELLDDIEESSQLVTSMSIRNFTRPVGAPELIRESNANDVSVAAPNLVRDPSGSHRPVGAPDLVRESSGSDDQPEEHVEQNQLELDNSTEVSSHEQLSVGENAMNDNMLINGFGQPICPKFKSLQELLDNTEIMEDAAHSHAFNTWSEKIRITREPITYNEAMSFPDKDKWKEAMDKEYESLLLNKTWSLVQLPERRKVVKCKWIFKIKYKPNGDVERYKARVVAKGFFTGSRSGLQ